MVINGVDRFASFKYAHTALAPAKHTVARTTWIFGSTKFLLKLVLKM